MASVAIKGIAKNTLEIPLVILAVLMAFVLLFNLLNHVFPHGSSLRNIVDDEEILSSSNSLFRKDQSLQVEYEGEKENLYLNSNVAAKVTAIKRKVKSKPANKIAWSDARVGLELYSRDAVQTFQNSNAKIQFDEENYINLGENSLIIIRKLEDDPILREKVSRLMVFNGELSGKVSSSRRNRMRMEIKGPRAKARVTSADPNQPALIKFKVNKDKTSTVTVLKGKAIVTTSGEDKVVNRDEAITLQNDLSSDVIVPPEEVRVRTPRKGALFRYKDLLPTVKFAWARQDDIDSYEILVARDNEFFDIVSRKSLDVPYLENRSLRAGTYYWKVRAKRGEFDGPFSAVRKFQVVLDDKPPELVVNLPPDSYGKKEFTITGSSEPGTVIFINNEPVKIKGNGKFKHAIKFNRGSNTIVVESIDKAGNVTYKSKIVNVVGFD